MSEEQLEAIQKYFELQKRERIDKISILNQSVKKGGILFTGSSLMEQFPVNELLMTENLPYTIYNRGVGGFTTGEMLEHMEEMVFAVEASKIFINIGTNDIAAGDFSMEKLMHNYENILSQIKKRCPEAKIYMMAYYPVNEKDKVMENGLGKNAFATRNNSTIYKANERLKELADKMGCLFINANEGLADEYGRLKKEFTVEGIHMYANAYRIVLKNLLKYIED